MVNAPLTLETVMEGVSMGTIRNRISEIMGRKRMSITDLMRVTGISYGTAWALYHGTSKFISFDVIAKLCDGLGVDVGELFEYVPVDASENGDSR